MGELTGRRVRIATPSIDGKYCEGYVLSLINTLNLLHRMGCVVDWSRMPNCSDISYARNRMFGAFVRSTDTDMVFIDADIAWNPTDVVRLLTSGKDFVAGVYKRKTEQTTFAFDHDGSESLTEVSGVGMGFTAFTRQFALKMIEAYPELIFCGDDGLQDYALFLPMIDERHRWRSEDYAVCDRWRKIGGKVSIIPDIDLTHFGNRSWSGSLLDDITEFAQGGKPPLAKTG